MLDLHSYGHDIEASWLIDRGLEVLKLKDTDISLYQKVANLTDTLASTVLLQGYDEITGTLNNECEAGIVDSQKIWWVQAEAVIGFYNAYQKHPDRTDYKNASERIWQYVLNNMIDPNTGEWYESITADGRVNETQGLVHAWKCPYHTGRMCIEMSRRLS